MYLSTFIMLIVVTLIIYWIISIITKPQRDEFKRQAIEAGLIKDRDQIFLRQRHSFFSKKIRSLDQLAEAIRNSELIRYDFFETHIILKYLAQLELSSNNDCIFFTFKCFSYVVIFYLKPINGRDEEGYYRYDFGIEEVQGEGVKGAILVGDFILTTIEKIMSSLDSDVEVQRQVVDIKIKRSSWIILPF